MNRFRQTPAVCVALCLALVSTAASQDNPGNDVNSRNADAAENAEPEAEPDAESGAKPALGEESTEVLPSTGNAQNEDAESGNLETRQSTENVVPEDHLVAWLHSLERAKNLGRTRRAPVIVIAGAEWCGPCRTLEQEIRGKVVQDELQRWVAVHVDVDDHPDDAAELAVSSIPALRVLSPDGRLMASTEGVMNAETLAVWLRQQFDPATKGAAAHGLPAELNAVTVVSILNDFKSREATVREAAISRLADVPEVAAAPVVTGFADGGLSEQLALLELLMTWEAPVTGLDPWVPDTVTAERIRELEDWVTSKDFAIPNDSSELSAAEIIEARRILRQLLSADAARAAALREQLARMGRKTLPLIRAEAETHANAAERLKLTAARYRVAATADLLVEWPQGFERLAAPEHSERLDAVSELVGIATKREEALLLELFSDSVPLVREIALKGLMKVSGAQATGALVRLLDDPDPNVRAAVLKQLAESPVESLIPKISAYAEQETDPDLVVHAARFMREITKPAAVKALATLLNHASWRVRAEAADGIYRLIRKSGVSEMRKDAELGQAFLQLLEDEDEFVAGIAIRTLPYVKASTAPERLMTVAETRPTIAASAVRTLGASFMGRRGVPDRMLQFASAEQASVRAAAAVALFRKSSTQYTNIINAALRDEDSSVRTATADAIFTAVRALFVARTRVINGKTPEIPEPEGVSEEAGQNTADPQPLRGVLIAEARGQQIDELLTADRTSRDIADWVYDYERALSEMHQSETPAERLAAARVLAILGNVEAFDTVHAAASQRQFLPVVVTVLPALTWDEKQRIFDAGMAAAMTHDERHLLVDELADTRDNRAPPKIWDALASSSADAHLVREFIRPLTQSYFAAYHSSVVDADPAEQERLKADAHEMLRNGTRWQKIAALQLIATADVGSLRRVAAELYESNEESSAVRADALRALLCFSTSTTAQKLAIARLNDDDPVLAEPALLYLALGRNRVKFLSGVLPLPSVSASVAYRSFSAPIAIKPPEGVMLQPLLKFTESPNADTRASAGYFRTLHGDPAEIDAVIRFWRSSPEDVAVRRMAFRAIAAADDARFVPQLRRMYTDLSKSKTQLATSEFYWTIHSMTGIAAQELKEQVAGEMGFTAPKGPLP